MDVEDHQLKTAFQPTYPANRLRWSDRYRIILGLSHTIQLAGPSVLWAMPSLASLHF